MKPHSLRTPKTTPPQGGKRRSPNGVDSAKPVALRLMPAEREKATKFSAARQESKAAFCRACFLRGLADFERNPSLLDEGRSR